ncbi:MAG: hypothetical protein K2L93_00240, partial [Muribaculaceae bacterium]|nr:hypothetical protein [Muribaculaceae bacterium]
MTNNRYRTATKPALALGMLFCLMIFMLVVTSLLTQLLSSVVESTTASLRIMAVLQDVLVFILPAVLTALLTTRYPGELLEVMHGPRVFTTLWAILALLVSIPAMNAIIEWIYGGSLPESMRWARQLEEDARLTKQVIMG